MLESIVERRDSIMAIPTGYEKLAVIGIAYKNDYVDGTAYKLLNAVYYNGATYVALKDDPITPPVADGVNWQYLAKGFTDGVLSAIEATDTSGLLGQAGATVGAQPLLDVIADKVATKLLAKNQVVNNLLATIPGNALDACQGKALMDLINQQNSDYIDTNYTLSTTPGVAKTLSVPEMAQAAEIVICCGLSNHIYTIPRGYTTVRDDIYNGSWTSYITGTITVDWAANTIAYSFTSSNTSISGGITRLSYRK